MPYAVGLWCQNQRPVLVAGTIATASLVIPVAGAEVAAAAVRGMSSARSPSFECDCPHWWSNLWVYFFDALFSLRYPLLSFSWMDRRIHHHHSVTNRHLHHSHLACIPHRCHPPPQSQIYLNGGYDLDTGDPVRLSLPVVPSGPH